MVGDQHHVVGPKGADQARDIRVRLFIGGLNLRHLRHFMICMIGEHEVDDEHVNRVSQLLAGPEPSRAADDLCEARLECGHDFLRVLHLDNRPISHLRVIRDLAHALNRQFLFPGCGNDLFQQLHDHFVTDGCDADLSACAHQLADHARASVGLARAGWPLHRKSARIECQRESLGVVQQTCGARLRVAQGASGDGAGTEIPDEQSEDSNDGEQHYQPQRGVHRSLHPGTGPVRIVCTRGDERQIAAKVDEL